MANLTLFVLRPCLNYATAMKSMSIFLKSWVHQAVTPDKYAITALGKSLLIFLTDMILYMSILVSIRV